MSEKTYTLDWGEETLTVSINQRASQSRGSVWLTYGGTMVMATANMSDEPREGVDFFPLLVDYDEKYYAAGRIKGSRFMKREGKPQDEAILTARMIDRTLRPLFDQRERRDVQVVVTVLSFDGKNDPDLPSLIASSLALGVSDIPWDGPIGAVRVAKTAAGEILVNPDYEKRESAGYDLVVAGKNKLISMIEASLKQVPEAEVLTLLESAQKQIDKLERFQKKIIQQLGAKKIAQELPGIPDEIFQAVEKLAGDKLKKAIFTPDALKAKANLKAAEKEFKLYSEDHFSKQEQALAQQAFEKLQKEILHDKILKDKVRPDNRRLDELRPLKAEVGLLPQPHGSGYFERGLTHSLSVVTLGAPGEERWVEGMEIVGTKRFMHHYNFPPFSTGETKPMRFPSRREIGHGALAEKALEPVLPPEEDFPYTVRVVTEVLSSNGSTSMASVCSSSLALMDAGVPIETAVTGIAMGIIYRSEKEYAILTDIQGVEDFSGHMDFKVAGTKKGLTALQLDMKLPGLPLSILSEALEQAKKAREEILEVLTKVLPKPRPELSERAPRVLAMQVPTDKIRDIIGSRGVVIQEITERTGAEIEVKDDGRVFITAKQAASAQQARDIIRRIVEPLPKGTVFTGEVISVVDFGAFVEIAPGKDGLVHISELAPNYVQKAEDIVKPGDKVKVKVLGYDERGRPKLSVKAALADQAKVA